MLHPFAFFLLSLLCLCHLFLQRRHHYALASSNDPQLKKRMDAVKTHALADLKNREQEEGQDR